MADTLENIALIAIGLAGLLFGGRWLVQGASRLASSFGISPLIIGLTVVSIGTSTPELLVSMTAVLRGAEGVSLGNIVGSNIANIGLILGITGLVLPISVKSSLVKREIPLMVAFTLIVYFMALNGHLGQLEGLILLVALVVFNIVVYRVTPRDDEIVPEFEAFDEEERLIDTDPAHRVRQLAMISVGIVLLVGGARFMVDGASEIAAEAGVSDLVIGFTIVAIGTSLPELATSVIAALRNEADIAVGNVIGSNIANLLLILGLTVTINPLEIDTSLLSYEFPVMIAFSLLLLPFAWDLKLVRREAALFLIGYIAFDVSLFLL